MRNDCDVLVIGGGGAAVRAAVEAARTGVKVMLVDKGGFERSGTSPLALHGFATVLPGDESEKTLISDIVRTGSGINDLDLVRTAVKESRVEPAFLEEMGVRFARDTEGNYIYKETGNLGRLIFDEMANGMNFVAVLGKEAWKNGVQLLDGIMIAELLVDNGRVLGAIGIDRAKEIYTFSAGAVVLAAGGANRIYPNVVPRISHDMYGTTGDGYALALHAGLSLVDMEFANFRDTPPAAGFRGTYINSKGEPFMAKYDPLWKEKAPRGRVVEAIFREIQAGRGPIYIEIDNESERAAAILPEEYKSYVRFCKEGKPPHVTITFQRLLGGARINPDASSEIGGLYIAGENAGGVHGADRLQGVAFLETQVFGRLAGVGAAEFTHNKKRKELSESLVKNFRDKVFKNLDKEEDFKKSKILKKIHKLTWAHAGIVRDAKGLKGGLGAIAKLREELSGDVGSNTFEVLEVKNLALTAEIVMGAALARQETRGTHLRSDFPGAKEEMARQHISVCYKKDGEIEATVVPSRS